MTKLEKVFEDTRTMKLLERVLIREYCPAFFGLKNNCIDRDCEECWNDCEECWNEEVEE